MIKCITLSFGYAEGGHPSHIVFGHSKGFETKFDALKDLALVFFKDFQHTLSCERACCNKASQNKENRYCGYCGSELENQCSIENFKTWVMQLSESITDCWISWGANSDWTIRWDLFDLFRVKQSEILFISSCAENCLIYTFDGNETGLSDWKESVEKAWSNRKQHYEERKDELEGGLEHFKRYLEKCEPVCV